MTHRRSDLGAIVAEVVETETGAPRAVADRLARAVLHRLAAVDVVDHLAAEVVDAFGVALAAHHLRDDVFAYPGAPHSAARIAAETVASRLQGGGRVGPAGEHDRVQAQQVVDQISYLDWEFSLEDDPVSGVAVRVEAEVTDLRRPDRTVRISRSVPVRHGHVVAAAFEAAMRLHEHEAAERFAVDGETVLNEHNAPPAPAGLPAAAAR